MLKFPINNTESLRYNIWEKKAYMILFPSPTSTEKMAIQLETLNLSSLMLVIIGSFKFINTSQLKNMTSVGKLLVAEPKGHVAAGAFAEMVDLAQQTGLRVQFEPHIRFSRAATFFKA